jgi:flavorubredoxin
MLRSISPTFSLQLLPAHFLHSEGNFNVYDPISKVLFSGDVGAAALPLHKDFAFVENFQQHLPYIEGFHRRYMCNNHAAQVWANNIAKLDIQTMVPQHGPIYPKQAFQDFVTWFKKLKCGTDLLEEGGRFLGREVV